MGADCSAPKDSALCGGREDVRASKNVLPTEVEAAPNNDGSEILFVEDLAPRSQAALVQKESIAGVIIRTESLDRLFKRGVTAFAELLEQGTYLLCFYTWKSLTSRHEPVLDNAPDREGYSGRSPPKFDKGDQVTLNLVSDKVDTPCEGKAVHLGHTAVAIGSDRVGHGVRLSNGHAAVNICAVKPPGEAYNLLADKGADTAKYPSAIVFVQSFYAGCYIGFGALLATTISEAVPGATEDNPGFKSFIFAGLFPVNLLLILLSGGILFTGTSAACPAAIYEGKAKVLDVARCLALSWLGNVMGSFLFAYFTKWCQLLEAGSYTANGAIAITTKKISKDFVTTFLKGIGCNWMVCMAVFLCGQAQGMGGKYLGIWFPISCFVMCGFEHIPANFYICALGLIADDSPITFGDVFVKNWLPVTLGNFFAGAFCVAAGYSFVFGSLGKGVRDSAAVAAAPAKESIAEGADHAKKEKPAENAQGSFERCVSEGSIHGM